MPGLSTRRWSALLRNEAQALQRPEGAWTADLPREAVAQALANYAVRTGLATAKLNRSVCAPVNLRLPNGRLPPRSFTDFHIEPDMAHFGQAAMRTGGGDCSASQTRHSIVDDWLLGPSAARIMTMD